jgi:hypothetical protein
MLGGDDDTGLINEVGLPDLVGKRRLLAPARLAKCFLGGLYVNLGLRGLTQVLLAVCLLDLVGVGKGRRAQVCRDLATEEFLGSCGPQSLPRLAPIRQRNLLGLALALVRPTPGRAPSAKPLPPQRP